MEEKEEKLQQKPGSLRALGKIVCVRLPEELAELLEMMTNKSEFVRKALTQVLESKSRDNGETLEGSSSQVLKEIALLRAEISDLRKLIQEGWRPAEPREEPSSADSEAEEILLSGLESLLGMAEKKKGGEA